MSAIKKEERIGGQRLILGDCREVMKEIGRFDAVVTDPPYGIGAASSSFIGSKKRTNAKVAPRDYGNKQWDKDPADMSYFSLETPSIIWGGNFLNLPNTKKWLIWDKKNDGMGLADCEMAWTNLDGAIRIIRHEWAGFRMGKEQGNERYHPTQKPIAVMEWCLTHVPNATSILDPFMGSGTTLYACQRMGRQGTGIELDPEYFDIACKRVDEATRQPDIFVSAPVQAAKQEELF